MAKGQVSIRTMEEGDLEAADRICRDAFGAFIGVDDVFGDADFVYSRWRAAPDQALVATIDGEPVGSNFLARWGSVGVFGPLSVQPARWDQGIARALLAPTMDLFEAWGTTHQGLFTFPNSAKHVGLYQRYGFWPAHLTAVLGKPVTSPAVRGDSVRLSESDDQASIVADCRAVTDRIYDGLDVSAEIASVSDQGLGDTVVVDHRGGVGGFAVCHIGPGTEAGSDHLYVKCAAAEPGANAPEVFDRLVNACEALAADAGCGTIVAGVNTARVEAYRALLGRGFAVRMFGVAMQRGADGGYNRSDAYLIDDWR